MTITRSNFLLPVLVSLALPATSWATNGYFSHGSSVAEKGLAGAGAAYSQDTMAAATNPAGMVWQGSRYDVGAAGFVPMRSYTSKGGPFLTPGSPCGPCPFSIGDGDQSIDSENEFFLIPQFGYNRELDIANMKAEQPYSGRGPEELTLNCRALSATEPPASTCPSCSLQLPMPGRYQQHLPGVSAA